MALSRIALGACDILLHACVRARLPFVRGEQGEHLTAKELKKIRHDELKVTQAELAHWTQQGEPLFSLKA